MGWGRGLDTVIRISYSGIASFAGASQFLSILSVAYHSPLGIYFPVRFFVS